MDQRKFLWAGLLGFLALFISSQAFAQADVIEKRQKLMKSQSKAGKAIKAAAEKKDYATIAVRAKEIMGTAEKIPGLFPKGSTQGKTKAKAAIWDKWDDFEKRAAKLRQAAADLASAANAKDAEIDAKVKAMSGNCGACHKAFREKEYSQ